MICEATEISGKSYNLQLPCLAYLLFQRVSFLRRGDTGTAAEAKGHLAMHVCYVEFRVPVEKGVRNEGLQRETEVESDDIRWE